MTPEYDTFSAVAERLHRKQPIRALGQIGLTTLSFAFPPKERVYRHIRTQASPEKTIPLQAPVEETVSEMQSLLEQYEPQTPTKLLTTEQLSWFVGTMYQFSDRNNLADAMSTPLNAIEDLHDAIVKEGKNAPVSFPDQFRIALEQAPSIPSAAWNLFLTGRQYARWRDTQAIDGFPQRTTRQKFDLMNEWEHSIAAVKEPSESGYQDAAGDNYYVWTHALSRVIYGGLQQQRNLLTTGYETAFRYGSHAMSLTHQLGKISVLGTLSNHVPASKYGNAIGDVLVDAVQRDHSH